MIETSTEQRQKTRTRITFYLSVADARRVRHAAITAGESSVSAFVERAALRRTAEIEQQAELDNILRTENETIEQEERTRGEA